MGSTGTPLKRHKSVKFHIEESKTKPSIKITVSSDALAETILANSISSSVSTLPGATSGEEEDGAFNNVQQQQKPALIQIVGNCCTPSTNSPGATNPPKSGVLCSCANGDENRTRIALDDFTVLEFPNCIDFGIKDFLCCKDEIELDLSSDTDASFLDATPPHRFSDSELENTIEAMSITLDTTLNPYPNRNPFLFQSSSNYVPGEEDEDEEETTEESFIMDEEEGSSSASNNSGATMCGGIVDGDIADLEQDEHPSISSSDLISQGDLPLQLSVDSSTLIIVDGEAEDNHVPQEPISIADEDGKAQPIWGKPDHKTEQAQGVGDGGDREAQQISLERVNEIPDPKAEAEDVDRSRPINPEQVAPSSQQQRPISRKILSHPKKHFKRQISLPASIFMSYLLEQNNKSNYCTQQQQLEKNLNHNHVQNRDKLVKHNKLNRSNSCSKKGVNKIGAGILAEMRLPLQSNKIDEYRSAQKVISGSTEDFEYDDVNNSNSVSDYEQNEEQGDTTSSAGDDDESILMGRHSDWSSWESKSDTIKEPHDDPQELDDEQQAFTSDVEKRSLILRHVRRLIRQDTTGNFAPPDFSI